MTGSGDTNPTPDVEKRIADILREHRPQGFNVTYSAPMCCCGDNGEYAAHIAAITTGRLLMPEQRTLADGMGGMSTNWKTGETTVHSRPCTRQSRWVTAWTTP